MRHIHESVQIAAPIEKVWEYFTVSERIAEWLMPNTFELVEGGNFTMDCPPDLGSGSAVKCEIVDYTPPTNGEARLVYTWGIDDPRADTLLEVTMKHVRGQTHVDIIHSGWPDGAGDLRMRHEMGWKMLLGELLPGRIAAG